MSFFSGAALAEAAGNTKTPKKSEPIPLERIVKEKPEAAWEKYFSEHAPDQTAVQEAVKDLMHDAKYDHVIAMIGAALRHEQPQSWMYETLCLAMQAAGRPKAEIERVVLSAVDFAQSPSDLMYVGAYLMNAGMYERALGVFRQVAALDPLNPQPYLLGLKAARQTDNLDGLRWASLGILSQAWPKEQQSVWQAGVGVANEILAKLKADGKAKEADEFLATLDRAVERDCLVIVTYTGDAQLDLLVQEPTGSICSFRVPRTPSGGALLGDAIAQTNGDSAGGKSEVYVCPQGFDGTYKLAIHRVFGKVAADKLHVKVITHYLGKNPVAVEKTISLEKDEAQIAFDLRGGRRKEPIADQQIANAAAVQMQQNVQTQVLAQQIEAAVDPSALGALAASRYYYGGGYGNGGGLGGNDNGTPIGFLGGRGAVGYQPVIKQYMEGASMTVTAVVSADRRYVRCSFPMYGLTFSGIGAVHTFNTVNGETGDSTGGTGGQGYSGFNGNRSNTNTTPKRDDGQFPPTPHPGPHIFY